MCLAYFGEYFAYLGYILSISAAHIGIERNKLLVDFGWGDWGIEALDG